MSVIENQLKKALIDAITAKELQKLVLKKSLLKTLEEGVDQDIKNIENNLNHLENLEPETLSRIFTSLEVPCYTNTQINILSKIFELFGEKESNFLCVLLDRAINEFAANRFVGKPQDFHSRVNPVQKDLEVIDNII